MLILVDQNDNQTGSMEKMEAHVKGSLHRAFSVFLFNSEGKLLIQQRAFSKYHTPGIWSNSCCSHPFPGEQVEDAAHRRLLEELGIDAGLEYIFKIKYRHEFDNGLTEHEIDHVFVSYTDSAPVINTDEVNDYMYLSLDELKSDIEANPEKYSPWLRIIIREHYPQISSHSKK